MNTSIGITLFYALYGREAPLLPSFHATESLIEVVATYLQRRALIIQSIKKKMKESQAYMKEVVEKNRSEVSLIVGEWI